MVCCVDGRPHTGRWWVVRAMYGAPRWPPVGARPPEGVGVAGEKERRLGEDARENNNRTHTKRGKHAKGRSHPETLTRITCDGHSPAHMTRVHHLRVGTRPVCHLATRPYPLAHHTPSTLSMPSTHRGLARCVRATYITHHRHSQGTITHHRTHAQHETMTHTHRGAVAAVQSHSCLVARVCAGPPV